MARPPRVFNHLVQHVAYRNTYYLSYLFAGAPPVCRVAFLGHVLQRWCLCMCDETMIDQSGISMSSIVLLIYAPTNECSGSPFDVRRLCSDIRSAAVGTGLRIIFFMRS
jgi:hypothetical protein